MSATHRDDAARLLRVVAEHGVARGLRRELAVALLALERRRRSRQVDPGRLDDDVRVGDEIEKPVRMRRRARLRRVDEQPVAVAREHHRRRVRSAALPARRRQEEKVAALPGSSDATGVGAELLDDRGVVVVCSCDEYADCLAPARVELGHVARGLERARPPATAAVRRARAAPPRVPSARARAPSRQGCRAGRRGTA